MIVAGNKIYEKCKDCGNLVQMNKWLFGSLHVCTLEAAQRIDREIARQRKKS